jgi:C1A family cysteine protease
MMNLTYVPAGLGWHRDLPDTRDHTPDHPNVVGLLKRIKTDQDYAKSVPQVDLREYFPDVADQGVLNASTAYACVALVEYYQRRTLGEIRGYSSLFLYKVTRHMLKVAGDSGADLRSTLKALVRFGLPPDSHGPKDSSDFDREPSALELGLADDFSSVNYVRLSPQNATGETTLSVLKSFLAAGFPAVFGFSVPTSLSSAPDIPYRPLHDAFRGGMAAVVVGYDDLRMGSTKGALLVRPSWGGAWGDGGYGWLPYSYVKQQLAVDFWTIMNSRWIRSGEFNRPSIEAAIC